MIDTIRIALADDQALVRKGLSALLRNLGSIDIAIEVEDGESLLTQLAQVGVDVIISDIRMPRKTGIEALRVLRERGDATPFILLTTFDDSELMLAAIQAGAQGFLLKDAAPEDLHTAIQRVARGETLLQPISLHPVRAHWHNLATKPQRARLTEREVSILRLIAGGYSNKEIARSLFLSEGTVKNYITDILLKLNSRDRTHAVLKAITQRLI